MREPVGFALARPAAAGGTMRVHLARPLLVASIAAAALAACKPEPVVYPEVGAVDGSDDEVVFRPGQILTYRVTMDPADREYLEAHGVGEEWLEAALTVTGGDGAPISFDRIAFRHKGSVGTLQECWGPPTLDEDGDPSVETHAEMLSRPRLDEPFCKKISYKFKFDKYTKTARFHGLKKLNLHAASRDPSFLREMLAYSTFYDFGVDAPRTAPARLYVNGDFLGLFIAVEDVDDRYDAHHHPERADADTGNLYKEAWPQPAALGAWGELGFGDYASGALEVGSDPADFVAFTRTVAAAVEQGSLDPLAARVDVEALLRYMAVDRAIENWDGVTALYTCLEPGCVPLPHNFYWYHDTAAAPADRFHLVPWDMDNTFPVCDPYVERCPWGGATRPVPNWNVKPADCSPIQVWGSSWVAPSGCDPLLALLAAKGWADFEALGRELADGPLRAQVLQQKALAWTQLIDPVVREDPVVSYESWRAEREALIGEVLTRAATDFRRFLDEGYVDQTAR